MFAISPVATTDADDEVPPVVNPTLEFEILPPILLRPLPIIDEVEVWFLSLLLRLPLLFAIIEDEFPPPPLPPPVI